MKSLITHCYILCLCYPDDQQMGIPRLLLVFLLSFQLFDYNGVEGTRDLLEREDPELENQLKLMNKPAVKTIKVYILPVNSFLFQLQG